MSDRGVDYPAYARTIAVVSRNGDLSRAQAYYSTVRGEIERVLKARNPEALTFADPVLNPLFSDQILRKQAVCDFTRYSRLPQMIEAWEAWVPDSQMRRIHEVIVADASGSATPGGMSGRRRDLLKRLWMATGKIDLGAARRHSTQSIVTVVESGLDPVNSGLYVTPVLLAPPLESEQSGVDIRLAQRLVDFSDREIEVFLTWAESGPGQAYYRALVATYSGAQLNWLETLGEHTRTQITPRIVTLGADDINAQLDEIARKLETVDTIQTRYPLRARLENLSLSSDNDPRIQALLAKVRFQTAEGPDDTRRPRDPRLLRDSDLPPDPTGSSHYQIAERAIERALEVAAEDAELHVMAGLAAFYGLDDARASEHFSKARQIDAANPMLALAEGDFAYAQKKYPEAEALYRVAIETAGERQLTKHRAILHLALVLDAIGRAEAMGDVIRAQLPAAGDNWQVRHDYAQLLLDIGTKSEEVAAVIAPIPKEWRSDLMLSLRARINIQTIIETAPAARMDVARAALTKMYGGDRIGIAICRSREPGVVAAFRTVGTNPRVIDDLNTSFFACAIQYRRADALALALPTIKDVDMRLNPLWQDRAVCGAAARNDDRSLALLMKAGADIQKPCVSRRTPREMVSAGAESGDVEAKAALAVLDGAAAGR